VQTNEGNIPADITIAAMQRFDAHNTIDVSLQFVLTSNQPLYTLALSESSVEYFKALTDMTFESLEKSIADFIDQEREGLKLAMAGSRDLGNVFAQLGPKEIQ
jgi:hypothetical protein